MEEGEKSHLQQISNMPFLSIPFTTTPVQDLMLYAVLPNDENKNMIMKMIIIQANIYCVYYVSHMKCFAFVNSFNPHNQFLK